MDRGQRAELRTFARRLADERRTPEAKAAARAIELLADEVDRLEGELEARREAEREQARLEAEREARRAERERRRGKSERSVDAAVEAEAAQTSPRRARSRPALPAVPRLRVPRVAPKAIALALAVALAAAAVAGAARLTAPDLAAVSPREDALVGARAAKRLAFVVAGDRATLERVRWAIDGRDVTRRATLSGGRATLAAANLADGEHTVEATVAGRLPGASTRCIWRISIDRTPPGIRVDANTAKGVRDRPLRLAGATEPGARVTASSGTVAVGDGRFLVSLREPPSSPIVLTATDRHGNAAGARVRIQVVPRRPRAPVRSVHVTFHAWADDDLRRGILRLVDEGRINSVEIDLKDESGIVGFDANIPLGRRIGAVQKIYDLDRTVDLLHRKGVYVVGRIVAFRDPIHAAAAWERGWRTQVVQTPGGGPYAGYGGSRTSPTRSCASTTSTSRGERPRPASTTSSTTTSAGPTARSRAWSFRD